MSRSAFLLTLAFSTAGCVEAHDLGVTDGSTELGDAGTPDTTVGAPIPDAAVLRTTPVCPAAQHLVRGACATSATRRDVNGDGLADIVIGAYGNDDSGGTVGSVSLVTMRDQPARTIDTVATTGYGFDVAIVGDVDGDGFADFATADGGSALAVGRFFLYYGAASGVRDPGPPAFPAPLGIDSAEIFGDPLAGADLDGDGFSDLIAASSEHLAIYRGRAGGLDPTPTVMPLPGGVTIWGDALAADADVDGDGYPEVSVAVVEADSVVHVVSFRGGPDGLASSPAWDVTAAGVPPAGIGVSIASDDFDGDGFADVAVSSSVANAVDVFRGGPSGLSHDVAVRLPGSDGEFGSFLMACDTTGDGIAELFVGAPMNGPNQGLVAMYLGTPGGLRADATRLIDAPDGPPEFGAAMACLGDVDGDGLNDVALDRIGRVFLFLGTATGISDGPAASWEEPDFATSAMHDFGRSVD